MNSTSVLINLSVTQLRKAAEIKERIDALNQELIGLLSLTNTERSVTEAPIGGNGRRKMSAAGRARMAAAAQARWAKVRAEKREKSPSTELPSKPAKGKRTMSAAAKAKIGAAARARWAKIKAGK